MGREGVGMLKNIHPCKKLSLSDFSSWFHDKFWLKIGPLDWNLDSFINIHPCNELLLNYFSDIKTWEWFGGKNYFWGQGGVRMVKKNIHPCKDLSLSDLSSWFHDKVYWKFDL